MFFTTEKFKFYKIVAGYGVVEFSSLSDGQLLVSFDRALLDAGIGDYNLVKMSSILPASCKYTEENIKCEKGSCIPVAYAHASVESSLQLPNCKFMMADVSVAIPKENTRNGLIMEYSGYSPKESEICSSQMAYSNMLYRGYNPNDFSIRSSSIYYDFDKDSIVCKNRYNERTIIQNVTKGIESCITLFTAVVLLDSI